MNRFDLLRAVAAVGFSMAVAGCATHDTSTHRWQALDASNAQYRGDNRHCSPDDGPRGHYVRESDDFRAYKACMETRGYVLTAVNPVEGPRP